MNKRLVLLIPIIVAGAIFFPSQIPRAHALTGLVCITTSITATSCPTSAPTIAGAAPGTKIRLGVFIQNSDPMASFDIYVKTDPTLAILNATGANFGPLIASHTSDLICINGKNTIPAVGACTVGTANGPGVVEVSTTDAGGVTECGGVGPCSGMAFMINYTAGPQASASTSFSYPTASPGCATSSVGGNVCVLVTDQVGTTLAETTQAASYGAAATSLVAVVNGADGNLYSSSFAGTWGPFQPLNGQSPSSPSLCVTNTTAVELVVRGSDNGIYHKTFNNGHFAAVWDKNPNGLTVSQPVCAVILRVMYVVVIGTTGELWATSFNLDTNTWAASWTDLNGVTPSTPALVATPSVFRLDLVVRGSVDNQIYHKFFTVSGGWAAAWDTSNRSPVPDKTIGAPSIVSDGTLIHIVVIGSEGNLYYATRGIVSGVWSPYTSLAGSTSASPVLVIDSNSALHLLVTGQDHSLYEKSKASTTAPWDATWTNAGGISVGTPGAAAVGTTVNVLTTGPDGRLWFNTITSNVFAGFVNIGVAAPNPGASGI